MKSKNLKLDDQTNDQYLSKSKDQFELCFILPLNMYVCFHYQHHQINSGGYEVGVILNFEKR